MLAKTCLTAEELNIPQSVYDTLLRVRKELADGTLHYTEPSADCRATRPFNMSCWGLPQAKVCGTVRCIGGWMHYYAYYGVEPEGYKTHLYLDNCLDYATAIRKHTPPHLEPNYGDKTLLALFFPPRTHGKPYDEYTTAEAVDAIERYLAGARTQQEIWLQ